MPEPRQNANVVTLTRRSILILALAILYIFLPIVLLPTVYRSTGWNPAQLEAIRLAIAAMVLTAFALWADARETR